MILSKEDTIYASKIVVDYFSKFERIDDYFRARKIERVKALPPPLFGMSVEAVSYTHLTLPTILLV